MSKDKVEVGDVWKHKKTGFRFMVTNIDKDRLDWTSRIWENGFCDRFWQNETLTTYYTYLGKSKANIDDLFKTENEV